MKFICAFSLILLMAGLVQGQVRIGGSDLLEPALSKALAEYARAGNIDIVVNFSGSHPATEALKEGRIDLAILAVPEGAALPSEDFRSVQIGSKVLAIVVPQSNPINQLTMGQLAAIFGEAEPSNITRWGQLGLGDEWAARSISLGSISQSEHSLSVDLFRHLVMQSRNMKRTVAEAPAIDTIRIRMQHDQHAIALLHKVPDDPGGMKVLPIARTSTGLAFHPTLENVASNDYPLRLPLYLVFPSERAAEFKDLLIYVASEEAAEAIKAAGLLPLSDQRRQTLFFEFQQL